MNKSETTSFIYMGDPQCSRISGQESDYSQWGVLLERALEISGKSSTVSEKPLLVLGGDIVNRGDKNRDEEWSAFFAASGELPMATPVNGAEESVDVYADKFINPGNGPVGHEKEFFSFDYGCCHFIVLNSDYMGNRRKDAYKFLGTWIRVDLAVNRKPVVFALMHHPAYTLGTSFEDDVRASGIRDNYMRLLYRYGVDIILCGHQHAYARSKPSDEARQITQIMGVSGGKHFDARNKSGMETVIEHVSVATVFETDGKTIKLRTIDKDGRVLDEYTQMMRPPKERHCGACDRFSECQGTGKYELIEQEEQARRTGDPLKPSNTEGISVYAGGDSEKEIHFSDEDLAGFEKVEVEYSVMRRGKLEFERKTGFRLTDVLEKADSSAVMILTNSKGRQKALPLSEVLSGKHFAAYTDDVGDTVISEEYVVPAIITTEEEGYRLIYGQQNSAQYNGRGWMRDIRQIEIYA